MTSRTLLLILAVILAFNKTYAYSYDDSQDTSQANQSSSKRIYTTSRLTTTPPVIDGILDDECWETGVWAGDFTQWIPKEGAKPTYPTYLKILYDDKSIYVAIRAFDGEPEKILRRAGRRDEFQGDAVGINFDSYHDHRTGFEFNVTAAGQKIDLLLTNPMNWDVSWNAVWYAKTGLEDSAWVAEYEIPLSQLRYSSDKEQIWGMHCWRWIDRLQEESDWEPQSSTGPGMLYQFGELHGIKDIPAFQRIEIMPYTIGKIKTFKKDPYNPFKRNGRSFVGNLGLDAKIGLSSNFTADITINPDFGQVESDPSVMNLTAFETYYEERRPFFLEGKNIFNFDLGDASIFYSRRIGHSPVFSPSVGNNEYIDSPENTTILSAVKISGKTSDGLAVGILQSITNNEKAEIDVSGNRKEISVEPLTNYTLARLQKDYDAGNTVLGGIVTSTNRFIKDDHLDFLNKNAFTSGVDFLHHWNDKEYFIDAKIIGSYINGNELAIKGLQNSSARYFQRPDADHLKFDSTRTSLSGNGGRIKIGKGSGGLWRYSSELNWRSPGLDLNDFGFMHMADIIEEENEISYFVNQPVGIFRTYSIGISQENSWDFGMNHISSGADVNLSFEFLNNWLFSGSISYIGNELDTRLLRGGSAFIVPARYGSNLYLRTDPSERLFFSISSGYSRSEFNSAKYFELQPLVSYMPSNILKFSMSLSYSNNVNKLQFITTDQSRYYLGKIEQNTLGITFRIDYNISPELSIQFYGSPFASTGKYSEFKKVTNPDSKNYTDRFENLRTRKFTDYYQLFQAGETKPILSLWNPDFNFSEFRSNFVIRWEYRPGSQVYLVWSQDRNNYIMFGKDSVSEAAKKIANVSPNNIFLLKFNYWFSM